MKKKVSFLLIMALVFCACSQDEDLNVGSNRDLSESTLELVTLKSGVVIAKKGDQYLFEGDIVLTDEQVKTLDEYGALWKEVPENPGPEMALHPATNMPIEYLTNPDKVVARALGVYPTSYNLWAMVRFVYDSSTSTSDRAAIRTALLNIERLTNIRFYNATRQPTRDPQYGFYYPYLNFKNIGQSDVSNLSFG